ncbi:hypothetical protein M153_320006752 [Pseudoloma neurophilia]|uniref:Uncharacterized protein n=1 Tax=Pseudoloma neurophilia TaxID=146866 RepID=A0A0R0M0G3_9MICR|nr:hypothetical protein M153_320006752 [Pseudoloma neurophilia]
MKNIRFVTKKRHLKMFQPVFFEIKIYQYCQIRVNLYCTSS